MDVIRATEKKKYQNWVEIRMERTDKTSIGQKTILPCSKNIEISNDKRNCKNLYIGPPRNNAHIELSGRVTNFTLMHEQHTHWTQALADTLAYANGILLAVCRT